MRFRMLGAVEAWSSGSRVPITGANQTRALAVLLTEVNHTVALPRLVDALWDDEPPHTARRQVQNAIAAMRKTFAAHGADPIERVGDGYRLTTDDLDWTDFKRDVALARARAAEGRTDEAARLLSRALELWQGPALAGLTGVMIESAANRIDESRWSATEHLVEAELDLGRYEPAVDRARELLTHCPSRQRATGQLMRGLHLLGRQEAALQVYTDLRVRLADELGLVPDRTLQQLYGRILRDELPKPTGASASAHRHAAAPGASTVEPATTPAQLPADLPYFTGRAAALAELESIAAGQNDGDRSAAVVAIDGMAGVGKTALAIHAAHRLESSYPDGRIYVDLNGYSRTENPATVAEALGSLLGHLGVPARRIPRSTEERAVHYRRSMDGRRVLLVLDNAATADQVNPLLPGTAGSLVITTGRIRPTRVAAAQMLSLSPMPRGEAVELLARMVDDDRIAAASIEDLHAAVELCGGLPMAIRVAATRLNSHASWSVAHLVRRLREGRTALVGSAIADCQVMTAIDQSYRRLSVEARDAYRRLGARLRQVDAERAAAVTGTTVDDTRLILDRLFEAHLLEEPEPGRYVFHDLVRLHAARAAAREPIVPRPRRTDGSPVLTRGRRSIDERADLPGMQGHS